MAAHEITEACCFMSELVVAPATTTMRRWKLMQDFRVHIRIRVRETGLPSVKSVTVPKGFETDFASVPRIFHAIFPPTGRYGVAALVHDYLCGQKRVPRREADQVFYQLMKQYDTKPWKAKVLYGAVRLYAILTGVDKRERESSPEPRTSPEP